MSLRSCKVVAGFRAECGVCGSVIILVHIRVLDRASGADIRLEISNYCTRFKKQRNLGEGVKKQWPLMSVNFPRIYRSILIDN